MKIIINDINEDNITVADESPVKLSLSNTFSLYLSIHTYTHTCIYIYFIYFFT